MINRVLQSVIEPRLHRGKAIIIVGPRQVGKTTMLQMLSSNSGDRVIQWNCDEPDVRQKLTNATSTQLSAEIGAANLVLIEARKDGNPGLRIEKPLILFDENGRETDEYRMIYHRT